MDNYHSHLPDTVVIWLNKTQKVVVYATFSLKLGPYESWKIIDRANSSMVNNKEKRMRAVFFFIVQSRQLLMTHFETRSEG